MLVFNPSCSDGVDLQAARRITKEPAGSNGWKSSISPFTVIIPTLQEASTIDETLRHLRQFPEIREVIVADGGSDDGTIQQAARLQAKVVHCRPGRGLQMNEAARIARGPNLMFLHADCRLPRDAFLRIAEVFAAGQAAGLFAIQYDAPHALLRIAGRLSRHRSAWTEFGEAGLFIKKPAFDAVGGFPDWPLMEDVEILSRLRRRGQLGKASASVRVSARRYLKHGVWRQQLRNALLLLLFRLGLSPRRLARYYDSGR